LQYSFILQPYGLERDLLDSLILGQHAIYRDDSKENLKRLEIQVLLLSLQDYFHHIFFFYLRDTQK
jgi:hypothetical protein